LLTRPLQREIGDVTAPGANRSSKTFAGSLGVRRRLSPGDATSGVPKRSSAIAGAVDVTSSGVAMRWNSAAFARAGGSASGAVNPSRATALLEAVSSPAQITQVSQ